jgi:PKD repeat protein
MQRLLFWLRLFFYSLAVCGLSTHAGSLGDIRTSYPADFGSILVGSAVIKPNSIQWGGTDPVINVEVSGNRTDFGLTGNTLYLATDDKSSVNAWMMESPQAGALLSPQSGSAPGMGFFFAPYQAGLQTETDTYYLNYASQPTTIKTVGVQGTGVADDMVNPSMTVSVTVQGGVEGADCENVQNCKYVDVLPNGEVIFTVTPQSKKSDVQYAYVVTRIQEVNNSCTSSDTSFKTTGITQINVDTNDYYHIVDGLGPRAIRQNCVVSDMPVLRSIGKSFQFRATNIRETKTNGYAQYEIFLNGHQDFDDLTNSKWPGSHKIYRLRTSTNVQQPTPSTVSANFTVNNNNTSSVTLTASASTTVTGGSIASYTWTFSPALPDGRSIITMTSPILTLTQVGSYSVSLQATDTSGNKNAVAVTNTVIVTNTTTQPGASVSANFTVNNNNTNSVTLTASASTTVTGASIASYTWTFSPALPDGRSTVTSTSPILTLTQLGTYSVSLQATDSSGNKNAVAVTNTVTVKSSTTPTTLTASFTATPLTGTAPLTVTLDASGSTGAISYLWQSSNQLSSTGVKTSMSFTSVGTYTITLITSDGQTTATSTQTVTVTTSNVILGKAIASFVVTPDIKNSLLLNLDASNSRSSSGSSGAITRYEWYVVDTSTGASVHLDKTDALTAYTLPKEGYYTISLVVTDDKGVSATVSDTIVMPPLLASFTATPSAGGFPLYVQLDASASTSPRDSKIVSYKWFTNGVFTTIADGVKSTVQLINPLNYVITLLVTDDKGRMDSASQLIKVVNPLPPIADFTATPATTANGEDFLTINLDASASTDPDGGSVASYQWCCDATGSRVTTTVPKLSLKFADNRGGDYKFSLMVSDNDGNGSGTGSNSILVEKTITLNKPEAKFCTGLDAEIAREYGQSLNLDNSCSVAKPSTTAASQIVNYNWLVRDFNDPNRVVSTISSKLGNAAIPLSITPGDYQIIVKAIDNYGIYGVNGTGRIAVTPPRIGNTAQGSSLSPQGVYQDSPAKFYAGVFANTGVVNSFNATDSIDLLAAITIDPKHRNQVVELLEVLLKNDDGSWYYKDARVNGFTRWDFQLSTLFAAEYAVKLDTATRHLKIWSGSFTQALRTANPVPTSAGKYTLYLGYRLNTGEIILNQAPFNFNVQ